QLLEQSVPQALNGRTLVLALSRNAVDDATCIGRRSILAERYVPGIFIHNDLGDAGCRLPEERRRCESSVPGAGRNCPAANDLSGIDAESLVKDRLEGISRNTIGQATRHKLQLFAFDAEDVRGHLDHLLSGIARRGFDRKPYNNSRTAGAG